MFNSRHFCLNMTVSIVNISQNWMFLLQAVISVHRTVVKGNNTHILLELLFSIILLNITKISLGSKKLQCKQQGGKIFLKKTAGNQYM